MKKTLSLLLVMSMVLTIFAGCGNDAPAENASGEVEYKDTLIYGVAGDQDTMDPHMNVTNDKVIPWVYSKLITRDMDAKIVGDLAESWSVADDEKTWTFNLRKGVKFHNGKELTAEDVKASYDRLLNKDEPLRYTETMSFITEVNVLDPYKVEIVTSKPIGPFEGLMTSPCNSILDADYIKKYGKELGKTPESCNGSGPYKLVDWVKDESMKFEAFPEYSANGFACAPKTPNLIMQVIPEQNSRAIAIETGQVDLVDGLSPDDAVRLATVPGIKVEKVQARGMHLFQFNCSKKPINDPRVRQAICYAVDKEQMVDTLFKDLGETPVTCPASEMCFGYNDLGVFPYNPEKAKELLAEAGYPDGFDIKIMTTGSYNQAVQQAEIIADYLKKVGLNPSIEVVEKAVFRGFQGAGPEGCPWDMFIMGSGAAALDADAYLRRVFHTEPGNNMNNYGFYSNEEFDKLVDEAYATTDVEKRKELYKRAEEICYLEDPVAVFINYRKNVFATSDKMEGFASNCNNVSDLPSMRVAK